MFSTLNQQIISDPDGSFMEKTISFLSETLVIYFFPINERIIGIPSMPHAFLTEWVRKRE